MIISKLIVSFLAIPTLVPHAIDSSLCTLGHSEKCAIDSLKTNNDDGSVLVYPAGKTRCAFDDYSDNTTVFVTRSTYFFQVFPNQNQDKSKLLLYFQGGGGCIGKDTCNFALQCQLGAEGNPFNDWNIVFLPYCTGDIFVGDTYLEPFESNFSQLLGNKQCLGQKRGIYLNGYNNAKAVLDWALENFPDPKHLVIGGYSAGSLGAQLWSAKAAAMWQVKEKSIKFQVLADSYVGVFPEHPSATSSIINFFGGCNVDLHFHKSMVAKCQAKTATFTELVNALIKEVFKSEWLFINSIADRTQRLYYELVRLGIAGYPFTTLVDAGEFYGNMTNILDSHSQQTNVARFTSKKRTQHVTDRVDQVTAGSHASWCELLHWTHETELFVHLLMPRGRGSMQLG
ncbi:unnamed protein product [Peronospora belbahrii]|uniref:Carboxylesterase type B domain-containing protein n=1 Tax=Peronospora belbahrii TaxID=622444 RepID=A0ABN8CWP7_9STRA|nr:unnamed protein product [Peronospora belbahrii]